MASKISKDSAKAFWNGENFKRADTEVEYIEDIREARFYLHGNCIARLRDIDEFSSKLEVRDCNYQTATTKRRLNAILEPLNITVKQEKGQWLICWGVNNKLDWQDGWNEFKA